MSNPTVAEASTGEPVLEAKDVSKSFPGVRALDHVSLAIAPGEVHALVGENGAGKSTLIKLLTGVYQLDEGQLLHRGKQVAFGNPRAAQLAGISTIYQEVNLVPQQSGARNLYLGREPRNRLGLIDFKKMNSDAKALLRDFQIDADVEAPVSSLGLGAQQMISVARAIALDANVVIMDEPTSSLETREVETLFRLIDRLKSAGVAMIYVSHRLDELYRICDRVTVLRDGKLVHSGVLADLPRAKLVATMLGHELLEQVKRQVGLTEERTGAPSGRIVLQVEHLERRSLLHDISLDVHPGEVVGLGGLLGSGRSETAKAIMGAQVLDSGEVRIDGTPIKLGSPSHAIQAGIALLPEDRKLEGILPNLSIRDNIALAILPRLARAGVVSDGKVDDIVATFMKRLNIRAYGPDQKAGTLSGGNQQKVLLARWLCLSPKLLILDEPTRGIDVGAKAEVRGTVDDLAKDGLGVLLISSETEELVGQSHRIVVLKEGRVAAVLSGDEVNEGALVHAIAGEAGPDDAAVGENLDV
ncbi:MAG: galactofuranose transport system ATP-binding protein [Frankiales bacterium]|nr:galactofuranose transport system ATP-binding protein [Frankiales bacterium]